MNTDRCYMWKGVFIPVCWGGALHGRAGCYCRRPPKTYDEKTMESLLGKVERLADATKRLAGEVRRMKKHLAAQPAKGGE